MLLFCTLNYHTLQTAIFNGITKLALPCTQPHHCIADTIHKVSSTYPSDNVLPAQACIWHRHQAWNCLQVAIRASLYP